MTGARSLTGNLTANASSYTNDIEKTVNQSQWVYLSQWEIYNDIYVKGAKPYYVAPQSITVNGTYGNYDYDNMWYEVHIYDDTDTEVLASGYKRWSTVYDMSSLEPLLVLATDTAYRIRVIVINNKVAIDRDQIFSTITVPVLYDDYQDPEAPTPPPFELPSDWVENTTNTIADKFVPFNTVTTPVDPDGVGDTANEFKDFLEGVQEHETLATVFMGYVSELLRLKGITAFLCFAICCCTMIAIFEMSGG